MKTVLNWWYHVLNTSQLIESSRMINRLTLQLIVLVILLYSWELEDLCFKGPQVVPGAPVHFYYFFTYMTIWGAKQQDFFVIRHSFSTGISLDYSAYLANDFSHSFLFCSLSALAFSFLAAWCSGLNELPSAYSSVIPKASLSFSFFFSFASASWWLPAGALTNK